jgi:hypothetical protein
LILLFYELLEKATSRARMNLSTTFGVEREIKDRRRGWNV